MTEPQQGATYAQLLGAARAAERSGFGGFFRSDHLASIGPGPGRDATEAWTTLAALARETERIRLGTLVSPMTFRHPAVLARMVSTVDQLSGGRVELGIGAGWFEDEHRALGIPLPEMRERMDRFEESAEIIVALLEGGPVTRRGRFIDLDGAIALPRPLQPSLPVIVGGHGGRRSLGLAVRLAAEYNAMASIEDLIRIRREIDAACDQAGRDPATLRISWMGAFLTGEDEATLRRRSRAFAGMVAAPDAAPEEIVAALRAGRGIVGTHAQAARRMRAYAEAGCERFYLQVLDLDAHDMLEEAASIVAPGALG